MTLINRIRYISKFVFLFIFLISINVFSQTPKLSYKQEESSVIQTIKGNLALIQIYSTLKLDFPNKRKRIDSVIVGKMDSKINNYKLLVNLDSKTVIIDVHAEGYLPLSITVMGITPKAYKVFNIFEDKLPTVEIKKI